MYKFKNELCPKIMLGLFKKVTYPYNLRNGLNMVLLKSKLRFAQKPLPTLVKKSGQLFQTG